MSNKSINFADKLGQIREHWSPKTVAALNDYHFKLVKLQGEFVWHKHDDTDEAFICLRGSLRIDLRDGPVELTEGELFVVPRGVEHRPVAEQECHVLLVEPKGVVNTGDAESELTAETDEWI